MSDISIVDGQGDTLNLHINGVKNTCSIENKDSSCDNSISDDILSKDFEECGGKSEELKTEAAPAPKTPSPDEMEPMEVTLETNESFKTLPQVADICNTSNLPQVADICDASNLTSPKSIDIDSISQSDCAEQSECGDEHSNLNSDSIVAEEECKLLDISDKGETMNSECGPNGVHVPLISSCLTIKDTAIFDSISSSDDRLAEEGIQINSSDNNSLSNVLEGSNSSSKSNEAVVCVSIDASHSEDSLMEEQSKTVLIEQTDLSKEDLLNEHIDSQGERVCESSVHQCAISDEISEIKIDESVTDSNHVNDVNLLNTDSEKMGNSNNACGVESLNSPCAAVNSPNISCCADGIEVNECENNNMPDDNVEVDNCETSELGIVILESSSIAELGAGKENIFSEKCNSSIDSNEELMEHDEDKDKLEEVASVQDVSVDDSVLDSARDDMLDDSPARLVIEEDGVEDMEVSQTSGDKLEDQEAELDCHNELEDEVVLLSSADKPEDEGKFNSGEQLVIEGTSQSSEDKLGEGTTNIVQVESKESTLNSDKSDNLGTINIDEDLESTDIILNCNDHFTDNGNKSDEKPDDIIEIDNKTDDVIDKDNKTDDMIDKDNKTEDMVDKDNKTEDIIGKDSKTDDMIDKDSKTDDMIDKDNKTEDMIDKDNKTDDVIDQDIKTDGETDKDNKTDDVIDTDDDVLLLDDADNVNIMPSKYSFKNILKVPKKDLPAPETGSEEDDAIIVDETDEVTPQDNVSDIRKDEDLIQNENASKSETSRKRCSIDNEESNVSKRARTDLQASDMKDPNVKESSLETKSTSLADEKQKTIKDLDKVEESPSSIQTTTKVLQAFITAHFRAFMKNQKQINTEKLNRRTRSMQTATNLWKETARHLEKSVQELTIVAQKIEKRRSRAAELMNMSSRSIGIQVNNAKPKQPASSPANMKRQDSTPVGSNQSSVNIPYQQSPRLLAPANVNQAVGKNYNRSPQNNATPPKKMAAQTPGPPMAVPRNSPSPRQATPANSRMQQSIVKHIPASQGNSLDSNNLIDLTDEEDGSKAVKKTTSKTSLQSTPRPIVNKQNQMPPANGYTTNTALQAGSTALLMASNNQVMLTPVQNSQIIPGPPSTIAPFQLIPISSGGIQVSKAPMFALLANQRPPVNVVAQNSGPRSVPLATTNVATNSSTPKSSTYSLPQSVLISSIHPAPLPQNQDSGNAPASAKKRPPKPGLKISRVTQGIVLSWNMPSLNDVEKIASYQLFAYQENENSVPKSSLWKKVGDVKALPLPMACTLTQFQEGNRYHFAVRAVDQYGRCGQYSDASSIFLRPKT